MRAVQVEFPWFPGFSRNQKQRSIAALHRTVEQQCGIFPVLEVSTKSPEPIGQRLSAFTLRLEVRGWGLVSIESAYQGSKVFREGGPFEDLYAAEPRDAKRDPRLRDSGPLVGFEFEHVVWPLEPQTAFYDWLYARAVSEYPTLLEALSRFEGFTDIEFNPEKSVSTQARSCAVVKALCRKGKLEDALRSQQDFLRTVFGVEEVPSTRQGELFDRERTEGR